MKKRILGLVLCLFMASTCFVGCSLYKKDTSKGSKTVAIRVGDDVITREEVQSAYTTYYNYGYGYSYSQNDLFDMVVRNLVNQKLALQYAKKNINISEEDFEDILKSVKEALDDAIDSREKDIIERNGDEIPERLCTDGTNCTNKNHNHETEEKTTPFKPYESVIPTPIEYTDPAVSDEKRAQMTKDWLDALVAEYAAIATRKQAFNEYRAELVQVSIINGKQKGRDQAFNEKLDELVKSYEESKLVEKLQKQVESKIEISDDEVLAKFNELVNIEKQTYAGDTFKDAFEKSDSKSTFLYYGYKNGENENNGYIFVQHILISFSDEVKAELSKLPLYSMSEREHRFHLGEKWLKDGNAKEDAPEYYFFPETEDELKETAGYHTYEEWENFIEIRNQYVDGLTTNIVDPETGKTEFEEDGVTKKTITLAEIKEKLTALESDTTKTDAEKAQEFRKMMFMYGSDPGMFNVGYTTEVMGYVLPADQTKLSSDIKNNSSGFVGEFVAGAYDLYNAAKAAGKNFAIATEPSIASFGAHFLMFVGETKEGAICEANIEAMKNTLISASYGQSVYEYVYSKLLDEKKKTAYSDFLETKKADIEIEYKLDTYDKIFK